jgi:hypothetical protein
VKYACAGLIEALDTTEAVALASTSPMAALVSIEVRPFLEQTRSDTGARRPALKR